MAGFKSESWPDINWNDGRIMIGIGGRLRRNPQFWRSIKYEEVYLKAYENVRDARSSISNYISFYNSGRPHSSLDGRTPDEAYFGGRQMAEAA